MKLLLDTHIFLWSLLEPEKLSDEVTDLLNNPETDKYISAVTGWEITIKHAKGSLILPKKPKDFVMEFVIAAGILVLPISLGDALAVGELPPHHRDPFDRMLIAQARENEMFIVTNDNIFGSYEVRLIEV
jgi:PIN domain nuclease of toxin-antitoxin system